MYLLYSTPLPGATSMQSDLADLHNGEVKLDRMINPMIWKSHSGHKMQPSSSFLFPISYISDIIIQ